LPWVFNPRQLKKDLAESPAIRPKKAHQLWAFVNIFSFECGFINGG
jgi:hypothetical protein